MSRAGSHQLNNEECESFDGPVLGAQQIIYELNVFNRSVFGCATRIWTISKEVEDKSFVLLGIGFKHHSSVPS